MMAFKLGRSRCFSREDGIKVAREIESIPAAIALQLFAYHVARIRGCEIDQPRNLVKSVTVAPARVRRGSA